MRHTQDDFEYGIACNFSAHPRSNCGPHYKERAIHSHSLRVFLLFIAKGRSQFYVSQSRDLVFRYLDSYSLANQSDRRNMLTDNCSTVRLHAFEKMKSAKKENPQPKLEKSHRIIKARQE